MHSVTDALKPNGTNSALAHAWLWANAVRLQAARVLAAEGDLTHLPEAFMLLVALRDVRRAAKMALSSMQVPAAKDQLSEALADFDRALPGIVEARDAVEHFDEYSLGVGRAQRSRMKTDPHLSQYQLAEEYAVRFGWADAEQLHPHLAVGPHTIAISAAADAASLLVDEIWAAAKTEEGTPTSRAAARAIHHAQKSEPAWRQRQQEGSRQPADQAQGTTDDGIHAESADVP
ncbi:hypothetical protein B0E53_01090 [Micromonospora sp. MH33]|uniref:hypothetical protein n=1 Tax=Micromonospora sp. MH33 TaxID=1945509 RepID=UPI000D14B5E4|nr:hypothetical protein [Micromonospora sp. MH33]PSK66928.1 hypothetical protein B0E53_01090 [Micromonospora sp. MH33]